MKKIFLLIFAGVSLVAFGYANPPLWTDDGYRTNNYPADQWYTGFVRDRLVDGANVGSALSSLERVAQNQLAESIIVTIDGNTQVESSSTQWQSGTQRGEVIVTDYRQAVTTATTATTVKSDVRSYHDPATGVLYAFAAVKRSDLAAFYEKQIDIDLNKAEIAIEVSKQLVAAAKKMNAYRKVEEAKQILNKVNFYRDLLVAVNAEVGESGLQSDRGNRLRREVEKSLIDLEQSTTVYIDYRYEFKNYRDDAFSSDPGIFDEIIKQALSENDCSITDDVETADYVLTLVTSTTQRSDGSGAYGIISYYANVRGSLYNRMTQKKMIDFSILNDPNAYATGRSPEDAATKAFKLIALRDQVLEKVLPKIKN